jgi:hypothetical protein
MYPSSRNNIRQALWYQQFPWAHQHCKGRQNLQPTKMWFVYKSTKQQRNCKTSYCACEHACCTLGPMLKQDPRHYISPSTIFLQQSKNTNNQIIALIYVCELLEKTNLKTSVIWLNSIIEASNLRVISWKQKQNWCIITKDRVEVWNKLT